ncbi:hypothetical protein [Rhizobium sp. P44RR-XXIV]|uniref:hypothetical protein n=1 Tax=Rhizobium sp. P44RR-XXIV TaxID=1921145 RepID=UPI00145B318B|nr:hypothetical protein [Rhizobium sp. P44RR-XXIV]
MSSMQTSIGFRRWANAVVFVGWLIYYSLPFSAWRNAFADWYGASMRETRAK